VGGVSFLLPVILLLAADDRVARLKRAIVLGDDAGARAELRGGADFLAGEAESAYALARKHRRSGLLDEMAALRRAQVSAAFAIERAETTAERQAFVSLERNPRGRNEVLNPGARTPRPGHTFLILDVVLPHPFPARLTGGNLWLADGEGLRLDPFLPWDGYLPVTWSPLRTWDSVNGEEEEVPNDRRRLLFEVRTAALRGAKLQLFGKSYEIPMP